MFAAIRLFLLQGPFEGVIPGEEFFLLDETGADNFVDETNTDEFVQENAP